MTLGNSSRSIENLGCALFNELDEERHLPDGESLLAEPFFVSIFIIDWGVIGARGNLALMSLPWTASSAVSDVCFRYGGIGTVEYLCDLVTFDDQAPMSRERREEFVKFVAFLALP